MTRTPEALQAWLEQRRWGPVTHAHPPQTNADGFDSEIHLVQFAGPALPAAWSRPLVRRLAALQAQLHRLPTAGFPHDVDLVDLRLRLPRRVADAVPGSALAQALDRVTPILPRLREAPATVCHGDLHPLNVLVDGDAAGVIDWTDAGLGDRHGDVARTLLLFEIGWIAARAPVQRALLRAAGPRMAGAYRRAYERHLPVDDRALAGWRPLHLLHGWSQAVELRTGLTAPATDGDARVPFQLADELERRFHVAADAAGC